MRLAGFVGLGLLCWACSGKTTTNGAGASSSGGASAVMTDNAFLQRIAQGGVDKLDLLFMIDNSAAMGDKQELLKAAVPVLFSRLLSPRCVDAQGVPTGANATGDGTCPAGAAPEFPPLTDIHLAIVSSSLGAHAGMICSTVPLADDPALVHLDDHAHLIGSVRAGVSSWNNSGFLAWDPSGTKNSPAGTSSPEQLNRDFTDMISATGEHGCAYEASLESWYRFLIDPEPPLVVSQVANTTQRQGIDQELLAQRAAFLRPDSLVAIVMLTDKNDCSIRDDGLGWLVSSVAPLPKATAACAVNTNDPCCRSCAQNEAAPPDGCQPLSADPVCMGAAPGTYNTWDALNDSLNLRCFRQKQRFGFDLLYDTERYVTGLTRSTLPLPSDPTQTVINPLYAPAPGQPPRDPALVFLAGIVGVPWQDIATADSLVSPSALQFLSASELEAQGRWSQLLGDPEASPPVPPSDPFMIETPVARSGVNPNVPVSIMPPSSTNPRANAINGHELSTPDLSDLQYACTFELSQPKICAAGDPVCDCAAARDGDTSAVTAENSPLCQPPSGGPAGTTQYFAKAYPGARELTVLRALKDNAIVTSICPKNIESANPAEDPNYGYNPAVAALIERLKGPLRARCFPYTLDHTTDSNGMDTGIGCPVVEVRAAGQCDCNTPGRSPIKASLTPAVLRGLQEFGTCGNAGQPSCAASFCMCQINQEAGADLAACQANAATPSPGFCYIDDPASPAVARCPSNDQRVFRFVEGDAKLPADGALTFLACEATPRR